MNDVDPVRSHYEFLPYPTRDPADEQRRLIEGSPSHPCEIDHFLFGGSRDWSTPFRALVAGGGTGDGLIMLAQRLAESGCPAEITYLDISRASREVAQARAAARSLGSIRFVTGDVLSAPDLGPFDYIDCCGVVHHVRDPIAAVTALAESLSADGGIGLMVYAPYGRFGVEPLQRALSTLLLSATQEDRLPVTRSVLDALGSNHPFARNALIGDHQRGDAEIQDLLLHPRERSYSVPELDALLSEAGLRIQSFVEPGRYDPLRYLPASEGFAQRVEALTDTDRASLAEQLAGTMKTHIVYATAGRHSAPVVDSQDLDGVPRLRGVSAEVLAAIIAANGGVSITLDGYTHRLDFPDGANHLVAEIDGRRTLGAIRSSTALDRADFEYLGSAIDRELTDFGMLWYSRGLRNLQES